MYDIYLGIYVKWGLDENFVHKLICESGRAVVRSIRSGLLYIINKPAYWLINNKIIYYYHYLFRLKSMVMNPQPINQ